MLNEEPSHGYMLRMNHLTFMMLYEEYFQQGSWKQNLFAFLQPSFNFLLPIVSLGIFPQYFILFLLPPSEKRLSLKFILSRTGTHARPEDNRPTYLSGSFIYLFFSFPPPFPPGFGLIMVAARWQLSPVH